MTAEGQTNPYAELPLVGPHDVAVGHALITMVEPHPDHERAYNRWYEDDHFFSGAMFMPWMFSGRRWVATRDLQMLRYPADSPVAQPLTAGCYLGTYWITPGRLDDHKQWTFAANRRLTAEGRINHDRTHVFTSFQDHAGTVYRSSEVPRDVFALIDPYPGLVLEVLDAETPWSRADLERWLLNEHLPARLGADSPAALAMVFRTNPADPGMKPEVRATLDKIANGGRRLTVLWFVERDPRDCWDPVFAEEGKLVADGGRGTVALMAPFIPSKMGTNTYDDQLRGPANG